MQQFSKAQVQDSAVIEEDELASTGLAGSPYQNALIVVSVTSGTKIILFDSGVDLLDARISVGDIVKIISGAAAGNYTVASINVDTYSVVVSETIATSGATTASFYYQSGAKKTGFDNSSNLFDKSNTQEAVEEINFREITKEPMGFLDKAESTISFNNTNRTFTISPASGSFTFYVKGHKFIKSSPETVPITDTEGLWYIYYSYGVLTASQTKWLFNTPVAFVSYLYWDFDNKKAIIFGEERHGLVMDWATHQRLHLADGLKSTYGSYTFGNYVLNANGSLDSHATFSLTNGKTNDEDNVFDVINSATPVNPFEQKLSTTAYIPIYYKSGSNGVWRKIDATAFAVASQTGNTVRYNSYVGGSWGLTNVTNDYYVCSWIFATNNIYEPIICILGQTEKSSLSAATSEDFFANLNLTGFPFEESQLLYRCFFKTGTSFTNAPKAILASYDGLLVPNQVPAPMVNYTLTSSVSFTTTSSSDTLITGFILTPQAGTYACWFSCDCTVTANNNLGQFVLYRGGISVEGSRRTVQGTSSNFRTQSSTLAIISFDGSQALDVRMNISVNNNQFTVNSRTIVIIRLGT